MITLTDKDIQKSYKITHAIEDIKAILSDYKNDQIVESGRIVLPAGDDSSMLYMPCINLSQKVSIAKTVSIFPNNANLPTTQGNILVTDLNDGKHKATMEASYLTRLRTGGMTAIATDKLASHHSKVLGVIGTGKMAFEQVLGVLAVRHIETISLFNRSQEKAETFKQELIDFGVEVDISIADSVHSLVESADIINCATQSTTPVFDGSKLKRGTHINGVGSFKPSMKEMDHETIHRADQIYVDDFNGVKEEAGELIDAVDHHIITWNDIRGQLVDIYDKDDLRQSEDEITLYKCVGAGYFDLAVANGAFNSF